MPSLRTRRPTLLMLRSRVLCRCVNLVSLTCAIDRLVVISGTEQRCDTAIYTHGFSVELRSSKRQSTFLLEDTLTEYRIRDPHSIGSITSTMTFPLPTRLPNTTVSYGNQTICSGADVRRSLGSEREDANRQCLDRP
jgi:hypothetical protein